jgi:hypothetical protein
VGPTAPERRGELELALVADRDAVPAARFADDHGVRRGSAREMPGPSAVGLLADRRDDRELPRTAELRPSAERRGEAALRVDRPPPVDPAAPVADRTATFDGVDVAEEQEVRASPTAPREPVADLVDRGRVAEAPGERPELSDGRFLAARRAVPRDQPPEDLSGLRGRPPP